MTTLSAVFSSKEQMAQILTAVLLKFPQFVDGTLALTTCQAA
jgi:hypothetical protein